MASTTSNTTEPTSGQLTTKELTEVSWRWTLASQACWNYEKMMATGYLWAMIPFLKRRYKKPEELKEMLRIHNQFFNTAPYTGRFILGIDLAIEEKEGFKARETVAGLKAGLMGPFAGVGDTIFGVLPTTILGSIAGYMGLQGNPTGGFLIILFDLLVLLVSFLFLPMGYRQGVKAINEFGQKLNSLTDAAILLGVTVVGALAPSVISVTSPLKFKTGEVVLKFQSILDQIMPSLLPAVLVLLVYWLLGRKGMTSTRAIFFVLFLGIVLYNLHILA